MKSNQAWKLSGQLASVESKVDQQKLQMTIAGGSTSGGAKVTVGADGILLFAVEPPAPDETLGELYVRGNDLIARYQAGDGALDRELYWRQIDVNADNAEADNAEADNAFAVEMIYSLQTDLLDLRPDPSIVSSFKSGSARYWSAAGDALAGELKWQQQDSAEGSQLVTADLSSGSKLAIAVYPSDLVRMELTEGEEETVVRCLLDADFLEKGVIRRTRMFAAIGGSDIDDAQLVSWAQQFLDAETPLTT